MSHSVRLQARVEIGPSEAQSTWEIYEISPDAFEDYCLFDAEMHEVESRLVILEIGEDGDIFHNDPGGPLHTQVRKALEDMRLHNRQTGELPKRKSFVFALPGENNNVDVDIIPSDAAEDME
jgi:6-phosphogluconolactonase/glucosamine-6-phosphate isomerase/deaminase